MILNLLHPAIILIAGALVIPLLRGRMRNAYMLTLPLISLAILLFLPHGESARIDVFEYTLTTLRIDRLSFIFALIFHIAAFLVTLYAIHVKDTLQHVAALTYAGAAIGATLAGDLITLFIYWEITAIASVFLIWARGTECAYRAGIRYIIIQVVSGLLLLFGALQQLSATGSLTFDHMTLGDPGTWPIFIAFGIKCAFPLLHSWLEDSYPEATITGTVVLSAFTTKLAVYALARGFAGTDMLIWIGAAMTAFPIFYAVIENDLRRVLTYSLNNQLGFMVVGIGIGTELALNGTAAHAFCHILYKALLFMSMGAVLLRAGTVKGSELGGLYKSMPYTTSFCIIGAASISAFPLFSGFVSKSMILTAAAIGDHTVVWLVLLSAAAGAFVHSDIKIPYSAFFAHDSGIRCKEAPNNMLWAMAIASIFCIGIGIYPAPLYALLPYDINFAPYTATHVITQLQLLLFSALAFTFLMKTGVYPPELRAINLDADWFYRRLFPSLWNRFIVFTTPIWEGGKQLAINSLRWSVYRITQHHRSDGVLARTWPTGSMVLWVAILLGVYIVLYLVAY